VFDPDIHATILNVRFQKVKKVMIGLIPHQGDLCSSGDRMGSPVQWAYKIAVNV